MAEGILVINAKKQIRIKYKNSKGKEVEMAVPESELSHSLKQEAPEKLNGRKVEFDEVGGQPKKVRPVGEAFVPPSSAAAPQAPPPRGGQQPQSQRTSQPQSQPQRTFQPQPQGRSNPASVRGVFHNPYNFVPAPPRKTEHPELGDHIPVGHHVLHLDRFTGVIRVKMTAITPLLVPDAANAVDIGNEHKSFPVRLDAEGKPYIPPTSIKGMLRSAYEAVTNSRLAVFPGSEGSRGRNTTGHGMRLAFRRPARVEVVPVRVEECTEQSLTLRVLSRLWMRSAAKLPRYLQRPQPHQKERKGEQIAALKYSDKSLPQHGDHVRVRVAQNGRITQIARFSASSDGDEGWVLITEPNIGNKKFERVFVISPDDRLLRFQNHDAVRIQQMWRELILNYQQTHEKDLEQRRNRGQRPNDYLGDKPGQTAWSRHVWDKDYAELREGMLCYVRLANDSNVQGIYPVTISRDLYAVSPLSLLPPSLRPATALAQLSPADRVFGWVNQEGPGAYRGNIRIGPVTCETAAEQAIEWFNSQRRNLYSEEDARREPGLPLAILGQPKPQQARFYVAASQNGEAQPDGRTKEQAGYSPGKGLRGRKVYPHHNGLPNGHWDNAMQDRTQQPANNHCQEYRRPKLNGQEQRDNQNRSIQGWVRPGTLFTFDIHVTNLSKVELGALLWLLSLPEGHFHRFGGGKPLGFGSVRLEIDPEHTRVYNGEAWQQIYSTLEDASVPPVPFDQIIGAFKEAVRSVYGNNGSFEQVSFIAAFLRMATGHPDGLPTHYPRACQQGQSSPVPPNPEGLAYEWFVANERTGRDGGPQVALPHLTTDNGLPMLSVPRRGS